MRACAFAAIVGSVTNPERRFADAYEANVRLIYAYFLRRIDTDLVDDAVAETFLVVWRRIDELPTGDDELPWVYGVAYKVLGNQRRSQFRRKRLAKRVSGLRIQHVVAVEDLIVKGQEFERVHRAAARLRASDREILRLSLWEELSHAEIARVMNTTPEAVKQRAYQARRRLSRELARADSGMRPQSRLSLEGDT